VLCRGEHTEEQDDGKGRGGEGVGFSVFPGQRVNDESVENEKKKERRKTVVGVDPLVPAVPGSRLVSRASRRSKPSRGASPSKSTACTVSSKGVSTPSLRASS
jgi:hypothetical protein